VTVWKTGGAFSTARAGNASGVGTLDRAAATRGVCHSYQRRSAACDPWNGHSRISPRGCRNLRPQSRAERGYPRAFTRAANCSEIFERNARRLSAAIAQSLGFIGLVGRGTIRSAIANVLLTTVTIDRTAVLAQSAPSDAGRLWPHVARGLSAESSVLTPINEDGTGHNRAHPIKRPSRDRLDPARECGELVG
jgi:hypothetical protein